jgi:lysozyme family protein
MIFDAAFTRLLEHEGGYSNHPDDPGKETMWGITARVARQKGYRGKMRDLPVDLAKQWYKEDYWDTVSADELRPAIRYALFDAAVNSGPSQAIEWLQLALDVPNDGVLGPQTKAALEAGNMQEVKAKMIGHRLQFMTGLRTWRSFGRGWANRLASILID